MLGLCYGACAFLLQCTGFSCSSCGTWDLSSPTRDQTCIPCIGRWILNHWTTREVPRLLVMREKPKLGEAQGWAPGGRARSGQRASCPSHGILAEQPPCSGDSPVFSPLGPEAVGSPRFEEASKTQRCCDRSTCGVPFIKTSLCEEGCLHI